MKKIKSSQKKAVGYKPNLQHRTTMIGIAVVLLGVLVVFNLLISSGSYDVRSVQGAGMTQTH